MSLENEDQSSPDKPAETICESQKHLKFSYTRNFLLSLSELDICKKLPSGFDQSILSEFEDASHGIQEPVRITGGLLLPSFRHSEYSSSPPTRGDSSDYSQGIYRRREDRSFGRHDRDNDSQSDWDSDSGRSYGNQSWRSWHGTEHDGLLGSGSFQRPSGYTPGVSATKVQANDRYQLTRSNEPYHPPRPYKAVPHLRRNANDSYNDETFGSSTECTSQDRAEEEMRRKASFEFTRKEQQNALQEKQKPNPDKHKNDFISDNSALLVDNKDDKRILNRNNDLDESVILQVSNDDSGRSSFPLQIPASRPLVPPGFTSTILERNSGIQSLLHTHPLEVGKPEIEESISQAKVSLVPNGTLDNQEEKKSVKEMHSSEQQHENTSISSPFLKQGENIVNSSSALQLSNKKLRMDNQLYRTSIFSESQEMLDSGKIIEFPEKVTGHKIVGESNLDHSTSILEKLFGSALTVNTDGFSGFIEHHDSKPDDTWSAQTVHSSKFGYRFIEDEKKPADEVSSGRPGDLLSLTVGGEKGRFQVSDVKCPQQISLFQNPEFTNTHMTSNITSAAIGVSEQLYRHSKQEVVPTVLTCEDLEQRILSEFSKNSSTSQQPVQGWSVSGAKNEQPKAYIDNQASQDLFSLLHKGIGLKDMTPLPNLDIESSEKLHASEVPNIASALDNPVGGNGIHYSGKTETLQTLFGTAFMKELQSAEAPVSVQRGPVGSARIDVSEPYGLSFPVVDEGLFPSSNHREQTKSDKVENWLGFNDPQIELHSSKLQTGVVSKLGGSDGAVEIQLPEEENLITVGAPVNPPNSMFLLAGDSIKRGLLSSNTQVDIPQKLAALNTVSEDKRSMVVREGPAFSHGPHDLMERQIPYHNFHVQQPSPQFHPPQTSHGTTLFHPLDSHPAQISSQTKFMDQESIIHHNAPTNHQFPSNMLRHPSHHPNMGPTGFYHPSHHPLLEQMLMPGNFAPPHLLREFHRGAQLLPQCSNQATGFMQEPNPMPGNPFGHRQPNPDGLGIPLPAAPVVGNRSNHPEAFEKLVEMEVGAKSKQVHQFVAVDHARGVWS